jgi:hypothetical protein
MIEGWPKDGRLQNTAPKSRRSGRISQVVSRPTPDQGKNPDRAETRRLEPSHGIPPAREIDKSITTTYFQQLPTRADLCPGKGGPHTLKQAQSWF